MSLGRKEGREQDRILELWRKSPGGVEKVTVPVRMTESQTDYGPIGRRENLYLNIVRNHWHCVIDIDSAVAEIKAQSVKAVLGSRLLEHLDRHRD